ncbi:MAG: DUF4388 domain-containing protein [Myxococcota bacterium]
MAPVYAMKFISGKYQGVEIPLPEEGELIIGRAGELDLVLAEDMVSRRHAKLVCAGKELTLTDLGSTNGTFVNGEKIRRHDLKIADRILIGTAILKVIDVADMVMAPVTDRQSRLDMMQDIASRSLETSSMSGKLEDVPLPDLLQLFAVNRKSGVLTIEDDQEGRIFLKLGQLVYATIGPQQMPNPMKAICRMLNWKSGSFRLEEHRGPEDFPKTFEHSTESILMEAMRQQDEFQRLIGSMPALDTKFMLCVPLMPKLSVLDKDRLDIVQAAVNFGNFQRILDGADQTDFEILTHLRQLMRDGYIETS